MRRISGQRWGRRPGRSVAAIAVLAAVTLLLSACGDDAPPELTIEQRLAKAEGRELTATEVDEKLALGHTLCRMDEPILGAIWLRLEDDQMAYQDVVFGHLCPERSIFYAGQTGRVVTEEAEDSDVVTSTTAPNVTTTDSSTTTTARATIAPAPSTSSSTAGPGPSTSEPDPGKGSSTTTPTTSPTTEPSESSTSTVAPTTAAPSTTSPSPTTPTTAASTQPGEGG